MSVGPHNDNNNTDTCNDVNNNNNNNLIRIRILVIIIINWMLYYFLVHYYGMISNMVIDFILFFGVTNCMVWNCSVFTSCF